MACSDVQCLKDSLFLSIKAEAKEGDTINVSVESYIVILVLCYCRNDSIEVFLVNDPTLQTSLTVKTKAQHEIKAKIIDRQSLPREVEDIKLPAIQSSDGLTSAGGLCTVLRWAVRAHIHNNPVFSSILGFRGGCLSACSEVSVWTKFCEVDFPKSLEDILKSLSQPLSLDAPVTVPEQLVRFETHLKVPVRTHNILKRKQDLVRNHQNGEGHHLEDYFESLDVNGIKKDCVDLQLQHSYAEGIDKTLSDLILWPCIHSHISELARQGVHLEDHLPRVCEWYDRLCTDPDIVRASELLFGQPLKKIQTQSAATNVTVPVVNEESLYSRDPNRSKTKVRHHDPEHIIQKLKDSGIEAELSSCPSGMEEGLDWHNLPISLHPAGGDLPLSRVERKCQQVESMVLATLDLAAPGDRVVDFCSGGGHVGLLLAYYLPKCQIILIENKEASLERARTRARDLQLDNIIFYQCNLDYFQGTFNVAVSLHACGVATDLVIHKCLSSGASLVCCPCCYGAVREVEDITYPKSTLYKEAGLTQTEFVQLCHFADRTEIDTPTEQQGKECMTLVDHDRSEHIREHNYEVTLCTLQPPDCTPKSNLIIALPIK